MSEQGTHSRRRVAACRTESGAGVDGFARRQDRRAPRERKPLESRARSRRLIGSVLAFLVLCAAGARAEPLDALHAAALDRMLGSRALRGARVGLEVRDLETGRVVVARDAGSALVPASNQKILLAAAALAHWGPSHRFETPVLLTAQPDAKGSVDGTLWVIGSGDPSLVSERLWKLAEQVRLLGIREIRGGLGVDTSYFDSERYHPDWEPISTRAYHAPTAAFAANYSSFRLDVVAAPQVQGPVGLRLAPSIPYLRAHSAARTLARGGRLEIDLLPVADGRAERVSVRGAVAAGAKPKTYWRAVRYPELYAASLLRAQLESHGIRVGGGTQIGQAPKAAEELLRFRGAPLGEIVRGLNKYSNNFIAEQLTKMLGADLEGPPGSWEKGVRALRAYLHAQGIEPGDVVVADGSGLSPRNRISASVLVRVLVGAANRFETGPEFLASLSIGGLDGTLEERLDPATAVRGKTGHLSHVGSLSGIVSTPNARRLAFSVLVNGARGDTLSIDEAIDGFVLALGNGDGADAPAARHGTKLP